MGKSQRNKDISQPNRLCPVRLEGRIAPIIRVHIMKESTINFSAREIGRPVVPLKVLRHSLHSIWWSTAGANNPHQLKVIRFANSEPQFGQGTMSSGFRRISLIVVFLP